MASNESGGTNQLWFAVAAVGGLLVGLAAITPLIVKALNPRTAVAEPAQAPRLIIADSNHRRLTPTELELLTTEDLRIARNEIFARHGKRFQSEDLQRYFQRFAWYSPTIDEPALDDIELANVETIAAEEARRMP